MWNKLNLFKKKNRALLELKNLAATFSILDEFEKREVVYWQPKRKILLVEESFALVIMKKGQKQFFDFLNKVALWQNDRLIREAYQSYCKKIEVEAVRKARKQFAVLTNADIRRIRQSAREEMPPIPLEQLDVIKEFDIFVVSAKAPSSEEASEDNGQLIALGHFDGKKVEMALYEDIKYNLLKED